MGSVDSEDVVRMRELLRQTSEFVACFELAESKMLEWQLVLEARQAAQEKLFDEQFQHISELLESLRSGLSQMGLARLRMAADEALEKGEHCVESLRQTGERITNRLDAHEDALETLTEEALSRIALQVQEGLVRVDNAFAEYDARQFARIASESCQQVERVALHALRRSEQLFRSFQWRIAAIALLTTLATTITIGLYVSNELPWESHRVAVNERVAGKALLQVWPQLSEAEKGRILQRAQKVEDEG